MSIRVGGILVPALAIWTGCASHVDVDEGSATSSEAVGASCTSTTSDGRAIGVEARLGASLGALSLGGALVISDTGELTTPNGSKSAHLLDASIPHLLSTGVLDAKTSNGANQSTSLASVANLHVQVAGVSIAANVLASHAIALCDAGGAATDGGADVAALVIDGKAIVVTGHPNQTINLGVVKIVINEVTEAHDKHAGAIHVAALHVTALGIADVVISSADAGIACTCPVPPPPPPPTPPPSCTSSSQCCTGQVCYNGHCESRGS